jgi:hypothetical protein
MANHWQFSNDTLQWNITFIRSMHDWEVDLITSFFNLLYSLRLRRGGEGKICWIPSKGGFLRSNLFTMRYFPPMAIPFPERAFGGIRIFREWHSLNGRRF